MPRATAAPTSGLQFIVDQIGEMYGIEQVVLRIEQDIVGRTTLADVRNQLERFVAQDQQHIENLLQILRMMLGSEASVQPAIERGRQLAEAILGASQDSAFSLVRGLMLLVYETAMAGRAFMQVQQRIENREIVGLLETNHHEDEQHLHYLETQFLRAAEELSAPPPR